MMEENPYAPPLADLTPEPDLGQEYQSMELASRWSRLAASIIDYFMVVVCIVFFMMAIGLSIIPTGAVGVPLTLELFGAVVGIFFHVAMHGYFLRRNGQTVGKLLMGIRIAEMDGRVPSLERLIGLRFLPTTLMGMIPGAGPFCSFVDALCIFSPEERCIHDRIAGTQVVKAR